VGTDLFVTLGGQTQTVVDSFVMAAVNRYFGIGTAEPNLLITDSGYRCYYTLPQDPTMGFIWAADSNDIRSEGMSYGMMIAAQMNMHTEFNALWKFAKTYMQYTGSLNSSWQYYFKWQGMVDAPDNGSSWTISFPDGTVPAPDGDQYFAAALYIADEVWGSEGTINYKQEADNITSAMLHNSAPIINPTPNMVVFAPIGDANGFTDPSYHLPAFYELFARRGPSVDSATWRSIAQTSRTFLVNSANQTTGLHPDYADFDGTATDGGQSDSCPHDEFCYDAWRVVMNMAVDYYYYGLDSRMKTQVQKYHTFFTNNNYLGTGNVTQSLFNLDGSNASGGGSSALTATLAAGALASDASNKAMFVNNLWSVQQQSGTYRYYEEGVYLLAVLHVAGKWHF